MTTIRGIAETAFNDISVLPSGVAEKTGLLDSTVKVIISVLDHALFYEAIQSANARGIAEGIKSQFKPFNDLTKSLAIFTTIKDLNNPKYWETTKVKLVSKLTFATASGMEFLQGLQTFDLVSLGTISKAMGNLPLWQFVESAVAFTTVKDVLVLGGTVLSIYSNVKELYEAKDSEKIINLRIALVTDVARCAILTLSIVFNSQLAIKTITIGVTVLKVDNLIRNVSLVLNTCSLYKAARAYRFELASKP